MFDIHVYGESVLRRVASVLTPSERARAVKATKKVKDKVRLAAVNLLTDHLQTNHDLLSSTHISRSAIDHLDPL